MAHQADVAVDLADASLADAVAGALSVEALEGPEGSRLTVRRDGAAVRLQFEAGTLADLRAAVNSALRLLDAARASGQAGSRNG